MNYLSICQELEEVNNCIKIYKSKIEEKKSRAEKLEEYKKAMENGVKPVYVESQEFAKPVNPIFILLESKLYFEELKKISDYDLAAGLQGAIVKEDSKDGQIWEEYLENIMKKRGSEWLGLYKECKALNKATK